MVKNNFEIKKFAQIHPFFLNLLYDPAVNHNDAMLTDQKRQNI